MSAKQKTLCVVLAGGIGSRLAPLTEHRAKPAVPFGGQYRIIDFTLSNCLHSGLRQILVLTQYKSDSLHRHLRDAWNIFNSELGESITAIPPQLRTGDSWYKGTADAIFQNLYQLQQSDADNMLILSGDHIYRMDYSTIIEAHCRSNADVTVACKEVDIGDARSFGVMSVGTDMRVHEFCEKPDTPEPIPNNPSRAIASMGVYVFSKEVLCQSIARDGEDDSSSHDFGQDVLPSLIRSHHVHAYRFGDTQKCPSLEKYWRDIGTIDAYYQANMDLLRELPPLDLYCDCWSIRKYDTPAPPARIDRDSLGLPGAVTDSMLSNGVRISGGTVQHSILSPNVIVESGATVEDSILLHGVRIGQGARLRNCIIDKQVSVPAGEKIGYDTRDDAARFTVSASGIVVVPAGYRFCVSVDTGSATSQQNHSTTTVSVR